MISAAPVRKGGSEQLRRVNCFLFFGTRVWAYVCRVCRQLLLLVLFRCKRRQCAGFSCDSRMVKMSRRGRQSAIQEIRDWSTEHLQNFLTDVSFTGRSLFVPPVIHDVTCHCWAINWASLSALWTPWRGELTLILWFTILIRSTKTARRPKLVQQKLNSNYFPRWKLQFVSEVNNLFTDMQSSC